MQPDDRQSPAQPKPDDHDLAADVIRSKISSLYAEEPSVKEEVVIAETVTDHRSKHQRYMHDLTLSGKSLADIQTAWHQYYQDLSDKEKHEVWQEFYASHQNPTHHTAEHQPTVATHIPGKTPHKETKRAMGKRRLDTSKTTIGDLKQRIAKNAGTSKKLSKKQHLQSLLFGLGMGAAVMLVLLFGFFNERFVAPFITPSKAVSNTPIIIDPSNTAVGPEPKVIIPKINVEIPVVYDEPSIKEENIQNALERGVVHYASTPNPGEKGNSVIVGHSSNNILNQGKYKFAFVLLSKLEPGDTIVLTKDSKRYVYKVYEKKIVAPTDVSVLGTTGKPSTLTLITCDPPGTSLNRLVVVAEQISPEPTSNKASTAKPVEPAELTIVPGNAPSLWSRMTSWLRGGEDE
jgi:sortase A